MQARTIIFHRFPMILRRALASAALNNRATSSAGGTHANSRPSSSRSISRSLGIEMSSRRQFGGSAPSRARLAAAMTLANC